VGEVEGIALTGVDVGGVTAPRLDGTRGSGLYAVPFTLSGRPGYMRSRLFVRNWDYLPSFTIRHRRGIARVSGDRIVLDGTTMDEVEQVHLATLKLVVKLTNQQYAQLVAAESARRVTAEEAERSRRQAVAEAAGRLRFDDIG
jgi:hypothetical protein